MTLYLETSLLVAALLNEAHSLRTQTWLSEQPQTTLAISPWVTTEFSSALAAKLRNRHITPEERLDALAAFANLAQATFETLPIETKNFAEAARLADHYKLGLRSADALHLAICASQNATICTLDKRLAEAGPELGVKTILV